MFELPVPSLELNLILSAVGQEFTRANAVVVVGSAAVSCRPVQALHGNVALVSIPLPQSRQRSTQLQPPIPCIRRVFTGRRKVTQDAHFLLLNSG
jgi:hypothetical protein